MSRASVSGAPTVSGPPPSGCSWPAWRMKSTSSPGRERFRCEHRGAVARARRAAPRATSQPHRSRRTARPPRGARRTRRDRSPRTSSVRRATPPSTYAATTPSRAARRPPRARRRRRPRDPAAAARRVQARGGGIFVAAVAAAGARDATHAGNAHLARRAQSTIGARHHNARLRKVQRRPPRRRAIDAGAGGEGDLRPHPRAEDCRTSRPCAHASSDAKAPAACW